MTDQVDLDEAGGDVVPLRPGPDGDLCLEEGARLGVTRGPEPGQHLRTRQAPVDGGGTHDHQEVGLVVGQVELAISTEQGDEDGKHRGQALARRCPGGPASTARGPRPPGAGRSVLSGSWPAPP